MINILIVGGGATASVYLEMLSSDPRFKIYLIARNISKYEKWKNVEKLEADLNFIQSNNPFSEINFALTVYLAGVWKGRGESQQNYDENLLPFKNFIKRFKTNCGHIVLISSSSVYDSEYSDNKDLIDKNKHHVGYAMAKLDMERILVGSRLRHTIFRLFHIVSYYERFAVGRSHVVTDFVYKQKKGGCISNASSEVFVPFLSAIDLVNVTIKCLGNPKLENIILDIGPKYSYSLRTLAHFVKFVIDEEQKRPRKKDKKINKRFSLSYKLLGNYDRTSLFKMVQLQVKHYEEIN